MNCKNDLWKYCVATGEWTWLSGSTAQNPAGSWGTLGVPSPANVPNGRGGAVGWSDQNGHLYLFGGSPGGYTDPYNDLWVFTIDNTCGSCNALPVAIFTATHPICPGTCTDFTNLSVNGISYQWFFPGANPSVSTDVNPQGICYNSPGSYDVTLIATNALGSDTLHLTNYMTVYPYPPPQGINQSGDTLFAIPGAVSYQWYYNGGIIAGATNDYYVAQASGNYNVVATDVNGCEVEAAIFDVLAGITPASGETTGRVYPNPVTDELTVHLASSAETTNIVSVFSVVGTMVTQLEISNQGPEIKLDVSSLASGMYYLEVTSGSKTFRTKFVKSAHQ